MDERSGKWGQQASPKASPLVGGLAGTGSVLEHDLRGELNATRPTASEERVADTHVPSGGE